MNRAVLDFVCSGNLPEWSTRMQDAHAAGGGGDVHQTREVYVVAAPVPADRCVRQVVCEWISCAFRPAAL